MSKQFGMFTEEGNYMVNRIAEAGVKLAAADGTDSAWAFAYRELEKLACSEQFEEATDTEVREQLWTEVVGI
jgi:hypothetical protein